MYDAEQGLRTQSDAFDALGVSVSGSDGKLRDTEEVMLDVADRFAQMENGAQKAALAQVLFGRAGAKMIPFLNNGRDGLEAMRKEADELGITMSGRLTKAAEATNDNLTRLRTAMEGVYLRVMEKALPKLVEITKRMVAWSKESGNVEKMMQSVNAAMKVATTVWTVLSTALEVVGKKLGAIAAQASLVFEGDFKGAGRVWKESNLDAINGVSEGIEELQNIWDDTADKIEGGAGSTGSQLAAPIKAAQDIIEASIKATTDKLSTMESELEKAAKKSDSLSKKFQERFDNVTTPDASSQSSVLDVSILELNAEKALEKGDIDGATKSINRAFDVLDKMKDAGSESGIVLQGMAEKLKAVGDQISQKSLADVEAKVLVDTDGVLQQLQQGNQAMQKLLDENPLVQKLIIDQSRIPTAAQQVSNGNQMRPVNLNLPGGETMQVYGNQDDVDSWQRQFSREATKRGKR
jgi:hypothetical protein